jgi:hypothetical protein
MRYKILSALAALTIGGVACGSITDVNVNPNGPEDAPPPSILSNALDNVASNLDGAGHLNIRGAGLWVQYYSEIQYRDEDKYIERSGVSGGWWYYNQALADFQRMMDAGAAASAPNWDAVGRIMKSYTFSVMTDAMGDIPYSEALQGDSTLQPKYDTQQAVYTGLFADLKTAAGEINVSPTATGFATGDIMYGGFAPAVQMDNWRKFANSLRLRLAMHLTNVDAATAQSEAAAAVAAGVFTSNDDNAQVVYLASSPNQNPVYTNVHVANRDDYGMGKTYVDSLKNWNDPRLPIFAQLNKDTIVANRTYEGLPNGLNDGEGPKLFYISRIGAYWRETPNAPLSLLTYSEVLFLEAEAAERGYIAGNPAQLYADAIRASMDQYGISTADANTYLAQPQVAYDAKGATQAGHLEQIAYQKWVSLFMQGMEAWTEVRRTQVPTIIPGCHAVFRHMPERLPYEDQEAVLNGSNMDAAVSAQGFSASNDLQTPLWFTGRTTSTDYPPPPCP